MADAAVREFVLQVEERTGTGTGECRRLRAKGRIPGNLYGLGRSPFNVAVNPKTIDEILHMGSGVNTIFQLQMVGQERRREAMIKELQRDPVSGDPIHVDFIRIDPTKRIQVKVPIRLIGIPEGVKNEGGIVDFVNRVLEVECMPTQIPEHLEVDISELHVNQHVSVSDLVVGEELTVLDDADQILAVVNAPKVEEEPTEAEEEEAEEVEEGAEPEVAKKGKEADETEAKAPDKKEK